MKVKEGMWVLMGLAGLEMVAQGGAFVGEGIEEGWGRDGRAYTEYGFASSVGDVLALSVFRALLTIVLCTTSVRGVLGTPVLGLFNFAAFVFAVVKTVAIFRHHHHYTESRELTHAMTIACLSFAFTQVLAYFYVRAETGPAYRAYLASRVASGAGGYGPIHGESGGPVTLHGDEGEEKDFAQATTRDEGRRGAKKMTMSESDRSARSSQKGPCAVGQVVACL